MPRRVDVAGLGKQIGVSAEDDGLGCRVVTGDLRSAAVAASASVTGVGPQARFIACIPGNRPANCRETWPVRTLSRSIAAWASPDRPLNMLVR